MKQRCRHLLRILTGILSPLSLLSPAKALAKGYPEMTRPKGGPVYGRSDKEVEGLPGVMHYVMEKTKVAHLRRTLSGSDMDFCNVEWESHEVLVKNARLVDPTLDSEGFQLVPAAPLGKVEVDFFNIDEVAEKYYPICEGILQNMLGRTVIIKAFDHNLRISGSSSEPLTNGNGATVQKPLGVVHGDYTAISAPRRLEALASDLVSVNDIRKSGALLDADAVREAVAGSRRYAIINLWRNIDKDNPVLSNPLACIDATTVTTKEWRTLQIHYADRNGENILPCFSPNHQWMFYPEMKDDEVLIIKQWDSAGDIAQGSVGGDKLHSTCCLHSAFHGPLSGGEAPERQSIEVRCVCIW